MEVKGLAWPRDKGKSSREIIYGIDLETLMFIIGVEGEATIGGTVLSSSKYTGINNRDIVSVARTVDNRVHGW